MRPTARRPQPTAFALLVAFAASGCSIEEAAEPADAQQPDARQLDARQPDAQRPDAQRPDAQPDARPDAQQPDAAPAPVMCGPEHPFDEALARAWLDPQNVACTSRLDCEEVELCPGEHCVVGEALNRAAAAAIDEVAPPDERCEDCGPDEPLNCPEPEPPMEDCAEGFCQMGWSGPAPAPPEDCEEARASWARALEAVVANRDAWCDVDADCTAVSFGSGCVEGDCPVVGVRRDREATVRARLAAHLDFNDCDLCGEAAPCAFDGAVRCDTFCLIVE